MTAYAIQTKSNPHGHQRYVIEIGGDAAGLVMQERCGFRFFASQQALNPLNRVLFSTPRHAEEACRNLLRGFAFQGPRAYGHFNRRDGSRHHVSGA